MKKDFRTAAVMFTVFGLIASCDTKNYVKMAEQSTLKYYKWLKSNDVDSILTLIAPESFVVSDTMIVRKYINMRRMLGPIVSIDLAEANKRVNVQNGVKMIDVVLVYKVKYSNDTLYKEKFSFRSDEPFTPKFYGVNYSEWDEAKSE
ncbi:MAG: hypothetical protein V4649_17085 [Bacteroidota bacterium]